MKKQFFSLILFFALLISFPVFSQTGRIDALKAKGILIENEAVRKMDEVEYDKILNFDFNEYRYFSKEIKVQVNRGPIIELESIEKALAKKIVISEEIISRKRGQNFSGLKHEVMPLIEIGFARNIPVQNAETLK